MAAQPLLYRARNALRCLALVEDEPYFKAKINVLPEDE